MTEIRQKIMDVVEAAIVTAAIADEVEVMPSGDATPEKRRAVQIYDLGQRIQADEEAGTTRYGMGLGFDGYARGASGKAALALANALYGDLMRTLFAIPRDELFSEEIEEGDMSPMVTAHRADSPQVAFSLDITIYFATQRGDPAKIN